MGSVRNILILSGLSRVGWLGGLDGGGGRGGHGDDLLDAGGRSDGTLVSDTELVGVLVETVRVLDQLDSVVGCVVLERRGRGPHVGSGVGDAFDDRVHGDHVGRGTTEEDQGARSNGGGLNSQHCVSHLGERLSYVRSM